MSTDLFISYAWTSPEHREWVRLFASQLHLLGYNIKIDEKVDYGSSLSGFMQEVVDAKHVLMIVDENYVDRADNKPESGVGIETKWISGVFKNKPVTWLSVVFVRNSAHKLPVWLMEHKPKSFDFNSSPNINEFPGAAQIDNVWRWVEGLSADKTNALPLAEIRKRTARIENINRLSDHGNYVNPALKDRVTFRHRDNRDFTIGYGEYEFKICFSGRGRDSVYVYKDSGLKAVGLVTKKVYDSNTVESFLTPARTAQPEVGQSVVLMNTHGILCIITIDEVQDEINTPDEYIPEHVSFTYEVLGIE